MNTVVTLVILGAYVSLLAELLIFRVPSVASTARILYPTSEIVAVYSNNYQNLFRYSLISKTLLFGLPICVIYGIFLYPLIIIWYDMDYLGDFVYVPSKFWVAVGVVSIIVGRITSLFSALTIRADNRQQDNSFFLHTTGPYRWSRNPGLVGMYLFILGVWLTMPSMTMAVGIIVYIAYMNLKVQMEEDFLANKFGQPYVDYRQRTGRYLP